MIEVNSMGGKAQQLQRLKELGFRIPEFMVLPTSLYDEWLRTQSLNKTEMQKLRDFANARERRSRFFAVRSSAAAEDGRVQSFAGIFKTKLKVPVLDLPTAVTEVLESANPENLKAYTREPVQMAVVIQEMLEPLFAGVAFSRAPHGDSALMMIESTRGLGVGVVEGDAEISQLQISRDFAWQSLIGEVHLNPTQTKELADSLLRIERAWGAPVDVEWALTDEGFFFLQARPITQSFPPLSYLSDANLSESYPDWTSPLSCDFVRKMYAHVFNDSAKLLGASDERRRELWPYYQNLVNEVDGHLYYNLQSYAAAMGALPRGEEQFQKWLQLVGFSSEVEIPRPPLQPLGFWESLRVLGRLLYLGVFQKRLTEKFITRCETRLRELKQKALDSLQFKKSTDVFHNIRLELENPHDLAMGIFNDYFLMSKDPRGLREATHLTLESVKPQIALAELAPFLKTPILREQLEVLSLSPTPLAAKTLLPRIANDFPEFTQALQNFLDDFGDRAFGDLKFENLNFHQDTRSLLGLILRSERNPGPASYPPPPAARSRFEKALAYRENCRLIRTRYFAWFREMFLILAEKQRGEGMKWEGPEDIFYLRWQELVDWSNDIIEGQELVSRVLQRKTARKDDVNWPSTFISVKGNENESLNLRRQKGNATGPSLSENMQQRLHGDVVSWPSIDSEISGSIFRVKDPRSIPSDLDLKTTILWTETTDPAWVYLLAQCQALVSLKGNALSHVAIIARELGRPMLVKLHGDFDYFPSGTKVLISSEGLITKDPNDASDLAENSAFRADA